MNASTKTVDEFLATVPAQARVSLEKLRKAIQVAVPKATETFSYGVPTFQLDGKSVVSFGAAKTHCALYVMSKTVVEAHKADLAGYDISPGTVRFPFDKPLPAALVKKLVLARIAENEAIKSGKKTTSRKPAAKSTAGNLALPDKLGAPAQRALDGAGYKNLKQLSKVSEAQIAALHGVGPNAIGKLRQALADVGLSFAK